MRGSSIGKYYYILFLSCCRWKLWKTVQLLFFWSKQDLAVIPQKWVKTFVQSKKNLETRGKWNILALSKLNKNYLYDRRKLGSILEAENKGDWLGLASLDKICVNKYAWTEWYPNTLLGLLCESNHSSKSPAIFQQFWIGSQIASYLLEANSSCHQQISNFVIFHMEFYAVQFYLTILHVLGELEPFLAITIAAITSWRVYTKLSTSILSAFINI